MTTEKDTVYLEKGENGVAVIYLNQPKKKNAINARMMVLLSDLLQEADADADIRAIILRGEGNCFTSGGDLSQSSPEENTPENARKTYRNYTRAISSIRGCSKPVIAMVDGYAVGGGFALVLACDMICIAESAKIIPAFCQIGIVPEMAVTKYLPALVGPHKAKEILFLGERISGTQMGELGLANSVCPAEELEAVAMKLAESVASMPDASIQVTKGMINAFLDTDLDMVFRLEETSSPFCTTTAAYKKTMEKFSK